MCVCERVREIVRVCVHERESMRAFVFTCVCVRVCVR